MSTDSKERLINAAIRVGNLNHEQRDSIRPMTNGATDAYHELEDAVKEYEGHPDYQNQERYFKCLQEIFAQEIAKEPTWVNYDSYESQVDMRQRCAERVRNLRFVSTGTLISKKYLVPASVAYACDCCGKNPCECPPDWTAVDAAGVHDGGGPP